VFQKLETWSFAPGAFETANDVIMMLWNPILVSALEAISVSSNVGHASQEV
jgi:hypothetical protein